MSKVPKTLVDPSITQKSLVELRNELSTRHNSPTGLSAVERELLFKMNSCLFSQYPHFPHYPS
jgi:hypothetical protein